MAAQSSRRLRWGIISTADIGLKKVIPGIQRSPHSEVVAIGSRDLKRAQGAAARLGIPRAYGSYDELLADPDVEAVYNPLPNHLHVPLTLQATRAGKHVLCEKPIAITAAEAEQLRQCPRDRIVMEAFMVRFHPQWLRAREIVQSGEIGELKSVNVVFSYHNIDPANVRNQADIGGGGILDIGCYPIVGARFLFGSEPKRVVSVIERDPSFRTDRLAGALVDFGNGRHLNFTCSTQLVPFQSVQALGTKGRVEIVIPFNAPQGEATTILVDTGKALDRSSARRETIAPSDQYAEQAEAFALAVLERRTLPYGIEDAIQNMRILDALFRSDVEGGWVEVS
ncbi:MAG TPA: Gfo/Idh/MocA family oxidoreductase [Dongiaceae bacterium]|jgi:predicted dehydrogenase|nr:Gfo/Idh/MocA family oxidoreductase [Dongiaceae bacterium]HSE75874.1 Gfo/Idh/MocA family oxidoreductase [Dongiaceae bacterium]